MKFEKYIKEELKTIPIKDLLKEMGLPHSKNLTDSIKIIEESNQIPQEQIDNLITDAIKYGSRRMLFISKMSSQDIKKISNLPKIKKVLAKEFNILFNENVFNILNTSEANTITINNSDSDDYIGEVEYARLIPTETNKDKVKKIELCFGKKTKNEHSEDDQGNKSYSFQKNYTWVDIFVKHGVICFRVPSTTEHFGKQHQAQAIFNELSERLRKVFGINYITLSNYDKVLFSIFSEITAVSEKPFKDRFNLQDNLIDKLSELVTNANVFEKQQTQTEFKDRLIDLFERLIIQENFKEYMAYSTEKDGVISKMQFTDETGGSVNASAGSKIEKNGQLELCDVFFDTRKTIKDNEKVDTLWIDWFVHNPEPTKNPQKHNVITTKFNVGEKYILIHFQHLFLTRKVENYVFSNIGKYKEFRWCTDN